MSIFSIVLCFYYVSQFIVETYCFADGRCLFKQLQSVPLESVGQDFKKV